jgi:hypothetical protein
MNDNDLSGEERRALDSLPRERQPSDLLEERTVRALQSRGLLHPAVRGGITLSTGRLTAVAATLVALLLGSFSIGHWLGSSQTSEAMLAMHRQDSAEATALVQQLQQTGSAYLTALTELAQGGPGVPQLERDRGRETALRSLYEVANQMVRLAPNDPVASRILQAFEQAEQQPGTRPEPEERIIWF